MKNRPPHPTHKHCRAACSGFGMMLIMSFITLLLVAMMSMMLMNAGSRPILLNSNRDSVSARKMAAFAVEQVRADIYSKLLANTTVDTSYRLPASGWQAVTVPTNPTDLSGGAPIGQPWGNTVSQYWATVTQAGGNSYIVKITAQVGTTTITWTEPMTVSKGYSCAVDGKAVEDAIFAGNIAGISDANLKAYAQHECMLRRSPGPSSIPFLTRQSGVSGTNCPGTVTYSGTGTLDRQTFDYTNPANCRATVTGDYDKLLLYTIWNTSTAGAPLVINYTRTTQPLEVHLQTGMGGGGYLFDASGSTGPIKIILDNGGIYGYFKGSNAGTTLSVKDGRLDVLSNSSYTGNGDDLVMLEDAWSSLPLYLGSGNDTFMINTGVYPHGFNASGGTGTQSGSGNDTFYCKQSRGNNVIDGEDGNDNFYLGSYTYGNIYGGAGDDTISCTDTLGSGSCTAVGDGAYIYADNNNDTGTGNDIVSLDVKVDADDPAAPVAAGANTVISGGGGNNILYTKGFTNTRNTAYVTNLKASTASGAGTGSLVIVAGNRSKVNITSSGANNVLLLKSNTTSTPANTNVCGAAFNDTQTSCANFAKILWY